MSKQDQQDLNVTITTRDQRAGNGQRPDAVGDPRLAAWRAARFGMFIHWGLYAMPHERWQDHPDTVCHHWTGEWIQQVKRIPTQKYQGRASDFKTIDFDAEAWVLLAKDAGMRYLVITAKHHDGFLPFATATIA